MRLLVFDPELGRRWSVEFKDATSSAEPLAWLEHVRKNLLIHWGFHHAVFDERFPTAYPK